MTTSQVGEADIVATDDFQAVTVELDGSWTGSNWNPAFPDGVGNFAALWTGLQDNDPCATNFSQQVAFIDDGIVVPGTGGSDCINWCYGPSGYIVNTLGGLAGPASHIFIEIHSPVMDWPSGTSDGFIFSFDGYRHEDLSADSPGIFYRWAVRSADTDDSAGNGIQDIESEGYSDRNLVFYGGPDYLRVTNDVTDLMNPGRDVVQIKLSVQEVGWIWGGTWSGLKDYQHFSANGG